MCYKQSIEIAVRNFSNVSKQQVGINAYIIAKATLSMQHGKVMVRNTKTPLWVTTSQTHQ